MKVKISTLSNDSKYYLLTNDYGIPITDACRYLKCLSSNRLSHSTVSSYAYNLAIYFEYLEKYGLNYKEVNTEILDDFITYISENNTKSFKRIKSIALTVNKFYEFLSDYSNITIDSRKILERSIKMCKIDIKEDIPIKKDIPIIEDIEPICNLIHNLRDELLVRIIFETGLRASEVINLCMDNIVRTSQCNLYHYKQFNSDISFSCNKLCVDCSPPYNYTYGIEIRDTKTSFNRIIPISDNLANLLFKYADSILSEIKSDKKFIFIHLNGASFGKKLSQSYVSSCLKALSYRLNTRINAHMLRHSFITRMINHFDLSYVSYLSGFKSNLSSYHYVNKNLKDSNTIKN